MTQQLQQRTAEMRRETGETSIAISLNIDGQGIAEINTPIGFMNHMLHALAKHALIDLAVTATGDIETGPHHTVEDTAIVLGRCIASALGDRSGIIRMSSKYAPLDEALSFAALDLSGRGYPVIDMASTSNIGDFSPDMARHFFESMAIEGKFNLHLTVQKGTNEHHMIESAFKAFARALREAASIDPRSQNSVPSTKGTLTN